jgi:protein HIRA/HIR1
MSTHNGAVTVVRFSPTGQYLASGSDDRVVLIWERDETRIPRKEFGSQGETDSESWVARKRLIGHDNDVQDLAWAPDSSILVTVGLDSSIIIWSGTTFEKLKIFDPHQSHVKGITFDPANKYFATASDDRTVRIIRYHKTTPNEMTFSIEATISAPFVGSPISSYFRRCSWSPDGNHIAAANATNGPVATVAIINRGTWDSDISLVGHEAPCEVASFCPRVFSTQKPEIMSTSLADDQKGNLITVVATSGQDKTLAIWNTSNPRPLLVAKNVADKALTDIVWSPDGKTLYASSLDGTVLVAAFEDGELGWPVPLEEAELQLTRYGGRKDEMQIPETVEQILLEEKIAIKEKTENENRMDAIMGGPDEGLTTNGFGGLSKQPESSKPDKHPTTKEIAPPSSTAPTNATISSSTASTTASTTSTKPTSVVAPQRVTITKEGKKRVAPLLLTTTSPAPRQAPVRQSRQLVEAPTEEQLHTMDMSKPSYALPRGGVSSLVIGTKRKAGEKDGEEANGSATNGSISKKHKQEEVPEFIKPAVVSPATTVSSVRLAVPKVQTFFGRGEDAGGRSAVLEVRNGTGTEQEPTKITVTKKGQVVFVDFLPRYGHLAAGRGDIFWAVATEDGVIHIYSPTGRRLMPAIVLGSSITFLESQGPFLMAITSIGMVHVWNVQQRKAVQQPVSLAPVLDSATKLLDSGLLKAPSITQCGVTSKGKVLITLNTGQAYTYNEDIMSWQRISESWWAFGSQYWDSTGVGDQSMSALLQGSGVSGGGLISLVERRTNEEVVLKGGSRGRYFQRMAKNRMLKEGYEGFEGVVSIAHLENRIGAAIVLESATELEKFLVMYARRIAEEGMEDRLEELCCELLGPVVVSLDKDSTKNEWRPELCGIRKHDLLRAVVLAAGKYREVQQVVLRYAKAVGVLVPDPESVTT